MTGGSSALCRHFARHNRRVVVFALLTAGTALACWVLLYVASYWLWLLVLTVVTPMDTKMPPGFTRGFCVVAAALCALAAGARWLWPNEYPRDRKPPGEIALEIILMVPRMTLAVWGNLRAWARLDEFERQLAWRVLEAVAWAERLPAQSVPLEIPDEKMRNKILLALQISDLIETREIQEQTYFILKNEGVAQLGEAAEQLRISQQ